MRSYLAVLKDSFREAFASRLLWVLLLLITAIHLGLGGLKVESSQSYRLSSSQLVDPDALIARFVAATRDRTPSPARAIAERMPEELVERLRDFADPRETGRQRRSVEQLVDELNRQLESRQFVDEANWREVPLDDETRQLKQGDIEDLPDIEIMRLNRSAFDAAFPDSVRPMPGAGVSFYWYGLALSENQPYTLAQVHRRFQRQFLVPVINWLIGFVGVLLSVLVTAAIIPRMFEPGEIDLLLSKPVSRPLLFLTKFFGGCAFITLLATYFVAGLWLLIGWRMELWLPRLLWCVPVLVFVFAVLYSVSALVGVVWRNAILSVVLTMVFWVMCFSVAVAREIFEGILYGERVDQIVSVEGAPWIGRKTGEVAGWDSDLADWSTRLEALPSDNPLVTGFNYPMIGPVYDATQHRLVAVRFEQAGFGLFRGRGHLLVALEAEGWQPVQGVETNPETRAVFLDPAGQITIVSSAGIERFNGTPKQGRRKFRIVGLDITRFVKRPDEGRFVTAYDPPTRWQSPFEAAADSDGQRVVVRHGNRLEVLQRDETGQWQSRVSIDRDAPELALLAISEQRVAVAREDGVVEIRATDDLRIQFELQAPWESMPKQVAVAPDGGRLALLGDNRRLAMWDATTGESIPIDLRGQGDISAMALPQPDLLWAADRFGRVTAYSLPECSIRESYEPSAELVELIFRWGISPLYTVFPKPGQLDNVTRYVVTGDSSEAPGPESRDLRRERAPLEVWPAIWSNLAFIAVMLTVTCVYVWRRDF